MHRYLILSGLLMLGVSCPLISQEAPETPLSDAPKPLVEEENVEERAKPMTAVGLAQILSEVGGESVQKTGSAILFEIRGIDMLCVYDENADRMRVISPIKPYGDVTTAEKDAIMDANFRGALDGRYASSNGMLYAAYIHPLSTLSRDQLLSGIFQVASLRVSFGDQYSSGLMVYGGERGTEI
ncbi:MAG: hypothetical protein AAF357_09660 [Verrucomicrobiota bacterium]